MQQQGEDDAPPQPPPRINGQKSVPDPKITDPRAGDFENQEEEEHIPKPPPRFTSQTSKMISLEPVPGADFNEDGTEDKKPVRPFWFRFAYFAVGFAIFGILTAVAGAILYILRVIKFQGTTQGRHHYYYFGRRVPKLLGVYLLVGGVIAFLFGGIAYHAALIRIDRYIEALQEYNSKKKRDARERGLWMQGGGALEHDPLMEGEEEEEDEQFYFEKKRLE